MRVYFFFAALLSLSLLAMLTAATGNESPLTNYFWWIISACALLVVMLLAMLSRYILLLRRESRHNMLGSRLARRLAVMFTLVALIPALFLCGVAAQFISYSINSWFGNDTAQALESSLNLSKSALNLSLDQSFRRAAALKSSVEKEARPSEKLKTNTQAAAFQQLAVVGLSDGKADMVRNADKLPPPLLEPETRELLNAAGSVRGIENVKGKLYANGWLLFPSRGNAADSGFSDGLSDGKQPVALFFRQALPAGVAHDAELIEAAHSKYAELTYAKQGLQSFFLITLSVATILAVTLALVIALYFARRFLEPILSLAEGAKAVAQGDFTQKRPVYRDDELGRLTHLFNHMTEQLGMAKAASEQNRLKQEAARHYLETVLESISAGVITIDRQGRLNTFNRSAEKILGTSLTAFYGNRYDDWGRQGAQATLLAELVQAVLETREQEKPVQLSYAGGDEGRILLAKATPLPEDNGNGTVLVFDDITLLVRAQKEAAWGEVAQRLAHEIRNPLTPIQLSAERLAWKLQDKLDEADGQILQRSTDTIIKQVAAMKEMVEAFRNYARSPSLRLEKTDFNQIIGEVLLLYEGAPCTFSADLSDNKPLYMAADAGAMRQVLHNIFKNAAEAAESDEMPQVHISVQQQEDKILLTVCNNGKSFSNEMLINAFEPYITDKPTGTGLGLPVVKKLIEEHGGRIGLSNRDSGGACVKITLPALTEQE
ncbi:MAG: PAS domain-containing sensor histidine kinase [Neisseria sp.]|nr:PAS domain-containing sensor histidine kinase [Neisseria sp.]